MLYINIIVFFTCLSYIIYRYRCSYVLGNVSGFVLNPLLYLVFFSLFYMVVGNIIVSVPAVYNIMRLGEFYQFVFETSLKTLFFFMILLFFYILSNDHKINKCERFTISPIYYFVLFVIGCGLVFYFIFIANFAYLNILPFKEFDRVTSYAAYEEFLLTGPYKYKTMLSLGFAYIIIERAIKRAWLLTLISFLLAFFVIYIDFTHGGRSESIKVVLIFYVSMVITSGKTRILWISITIFSWLIYSAIERAGVNASIELYQVFAEFYGTRATSDIVIGTNMRGIWHTPSTCTIMSILPAFIKAMIGEVDGCFIGHIITDKINYSYGLAQNIVTESIFFWGDFYIISSVFVGLYFFIINKFWMKFGFIGFIFLFLTIIDTQGMIRSSFYHFSLRLFYLMFTYYLIFNVLLHKKKLFTKDNAITMST